MKEAVLLKKFLTEYSRIGSRLFRNNTGRGWTGSRCIHIKEPTTVTLNKGDMVIHKVRPFSSGWPTGSSDLIGWTRVNITNDLVGRDVAVFTAVEAKTPNVTATREQLNFCKTVNDHGGIGVVARSLTDIFDAASNYFKGDCYEDRH